MVRLRGTVLRPWCYGTLIATCVLTVIALLFPYLAQGQSVREQSPDQAASVLQGSVRDSRGHPVVTATVYLLPETGTQTLTAVTDSAGAYRFPALREGVYTLRAEMTGFREAALTSCVVGPKETKRVDLTLDSAMISPKQNSSAETSEASQPQFFDDPQFTVAGVTEAMNPGGHGSDTILRTTEALAKETASLGVPEANEEPRSSHTSAATSLSSSTWEETLRKAAEHDPRNFETNRQLGKLLVDDGKAREAIPYLERASQLNRGDYQNSYEMALAYSDVGQYQRARSEARTLLAREDKSGPKPGELHHLLADIDEKLGDPLEADREYQRAAELDPSEPRLFDWAADLLLHRAYEPAIDVFTKGNRLFPQSARMLAGFGAAAYARGDYEAATQRLCEASDLNPNDPGPYLFLGKMQNLRIAQSECVVERLQRFTRVQPENALANYYYALSLWIRHEHSASAESLAQVERLLEKTIQLDPKFGPGYLQLGILYSDRGDSSKATAAYQKATEATPGLEEAHYRLAQAYSRAGQKSRAQAELRLYEQLSKKTADEVERKRRETQQFVYTLRAPATVSPQ
ncbi:MAG TPA: carboxypeptidase regulatory-like domain-containing protein [Terriglobales bacterium]|jgi:tetratricopeptide (TPR) repeat protein|nr:carboxypeptidase regulatory-like domain-containing protein [Terriglobales bacterium]